MLDYKINLQHNRSMCVNYQGQNMEDMNSLLEQSIFPIYGNRVKKSSTYKYIYTAKKKIVTDSFVVFYRTIEILNINLPKSHNPIFGISISRKVGNAVKRNRIKRLFRESIKLTGYSFPEKIGFVFVIRPDNVLKDMDSFLNEISIVVKKLKKYIARLNDQASPVGFEPTTP